MVGRRVGTPGQPLAPDDWVTARVLRGEEAPRDTIEIETADTPPLRRIVLITGAPILDEGGAIAGAVVTQMDVTDRVRGRGSAAPGRPPQG